MTVLKVVCNCRISWSWGGFSHELVTVWKRTIGHKLLLICYRLDVASFHMKNLIKELCRKVILDQAGTEASACAHKFCLRLHLDFDYQ